MNCFKKFATIGLAGMLILSCGIVNGESTEKVNMSAIQKASVSEMVRVSGKITLPEGHDGEAFKLTVKLVPQGDKEGYTKVIEISEEDSYDFEFLVEEGKYDISYYDYSVNHGSSKYSYGEYKGILVKDGDVEGIDIELKHNVFFN